MNETSLIQVMILTPVRVWPGLQFTSTTVPTMTGKVLLVVMSDTAAGSSVHVSEGERVILLSFTLLSCYYLPTPYSHLYAYDLSYSCSIHMLIS